MNNIKNSLSQDNGSTYTHSQTKSRKKGEFEVGQWPLDSLCDEIYLQLDSKWTKGKKDGSRKRKYRELAKSYAYRLPMDGLAIFYIDPDDLSMRIIEELEHIDYELADYVMKEVIGRIFDSVGESVLEAKRQTSYGMGVDPEVRDMHSPHSIQ